MESCKIILTVFEDWIDKYANLNTFVSLLVGIAGLILAVYFYKKQKRSAMLLTETIVNSQPVDTFLGVSLKVDHTSRRITGYGVSEGNIIQAGYYKANYEVEAELTITIQNESPNTIYALEVSYIPNQYSQKYSLIDTRDNKLQPLDGNKHFDFKLRIMNEYFDMYAQDVDKEFGSRVCKVGKGVSLLNGSKICLKFKDANHKEHSITKVVD